MKRHCCPALRDAVDRLDASSTLAELRAGESALVRAARLLPHGTEWAASLRVAAQHVVAAVEHVSATGGTDTARIRLEVSRNALRALIALIDGDRHS